MIHLQGFARAVSRGEPARTEQASPRQHSHQAESNAAARASAIAHNQFRPY